MTTDRSDRFTMQPGGVILSQCLYCRHYAGGTFGAVCAAFPNQIPQDVLDNQVDHRRPYPDGQEADVLFEPRADVDPATLAPLLRTLDALNHA